MKKHLIYINAILTFVIASCFLVAGCQSLETPQELLDKAARLIDEGENEPAIGLLRPFIYHHQDNYRAHFLMGQAFLNKDVENEKSLYIARYYLNKARDLAEYESQRQQADLAYADIKLLMDKGNHSGEILLETAERAGTLGRKGQATLLCMQAASLFIEEADYDSAQEACKTGQKYTETEDQRMELKLGLATAYFLETEYDQCFEIIKQLPESLSLIGRITTLDPDFLKKATDLIGMEGKRKWVPWKKGFDENSKKQYISNFKSIVAHHEETKFQLDEKRTKLVAESWLIIAKHSVENGMPIQARQAYEFSQSLFLKASNEDRALSVGEELENLDS
jgi:hypothetical protein